MTASSRHFIEAVRKMDNSPDKHGRPAGMEGHLRAAEREQPTGVQRQAIADLRASATFVPEPEHRHPGANLPSVARVRGASGQIGDRAASPNGLTVDDYQFLSELPRDPRAIGYNDARRLLTLQKIAHAPGADRADRDLIDEVANPVKAHHDRLAAAVMVRNAEGRQLPPVPASVPAAVADGIAAEVPALLPGEVLDRAFNAVTDVAQQRLRNQQDAVAKAHAALAAAEAQSPSNATH